MACGSKVLFIGQSNLNVIFISIILLAVAHIVLLLLSD